MRKTLLVSLCILTAAAAAQAALPFEDTFDSTIYGTNTQLNYQGDWGAQSNAFIVTTDELSINLDFRNAVIKGDNSFVNLQPGESMQISCDTVITMTNGVPNYHMFEFAFKNNEQDWTQDTSNRLAGAVRWSEWDIGSIRVAPDHDTAGSTVPVTAIMGSDLAGFDPDGGIDFVSDPLNLIYTVTKSEVTNEFTCTMVISNTVSAISVNKTLNNVISTNLWEATNIWCYIRSVDFVEYSGASGLSGGEVVIDNLKLEHIPVQRDTILWTENFDAQPDGTQVGYISGWQLNANVNGWNVTNGVATQRPNLPGNTGTGYRGVMRNEAPWTPGADETMILQFDWTLHTDGRRNGTLVDFQFQTNFWDGTGWPPATAAYDSVSNTAFGVRFQQNLWPGPADGQLTSNGLIQVISSIDSVTNSYLPSLFGLAPEDGDNTGDPMRVTYSAFKTTTTNVWIIDVVLTNKISGEVIDLETLTVTNADWYASSNFYFGSYAGGPLTNGLMGSEFDNFVGILRGAAPPTGWEAFLAQYPVLSGNPYADYDSDGLQDVAEYGLGGIPTDSADVGNEPYLEYGTDNNVRHYHYELSDPNRGISYTVEMTDDLVINNWTAYTDALPGWWNGSTSTTVNATFDEVMYRFWGGAGAPNDNYVRIFVTLDP